MSNEIKITNKERLKPSNFIKFLLKLLLHQSKSKNTTNSANDVADSENYDLNYFKTPFQ